MNWHDILKVQTQTQRQGFRLDDKDEDYVLEDEEETCYEKLVKLLTQQEGFKKGMETEDGQTRYQFFHRDIEDIFIEILLVQNHEEELYCWLVEKYSLFPGDLASGMKSALNRTMRLTNPKLDWRRTFNIGDIPVYGGTLFTPSDGEDTARLSENFYIEDKRAIILIDAYKKTR